MQSLIVYNNAWGGRGGYWRHLDGVLKMDGVVKRWGRKAEEDLAWRGCLI